MFCFKKSILIFVFVFAFVSSSIFLVFAYDSETTHPLLTKRAIELYNQFYQSNLSQQEISWIVEGSQKEDTPPRWINHFFDPSTGLGWQGERMGELPNQIVLFFSQMGLSPEQAVSSLNWAKNQELQTKYFYYEGNQTWQKAINEYAQGNKKNAYIALGHILHLLQDLSVPAHTRQDTHLDMFGDSGEPYEKWAKENGNLSFLNNLFSIDFNCSSLEDCFNKIAKYSQENFFSEDTILDSFYKKPLATRFANVNGFKTYYAVNDKNIEYPLAVEDPLKNGHLSLNIPGTNILSSYFQLLSRQNVQASAALINIFQQEAEKAKQDKTLIEPLPKTSFLNIKFPLISLYGEIVKLQNFFIAIKNTTEQNLVEAGNSVANEINKLQVLFSQYSKQASNFINDSAEALFGSLQSSQQTTEQQTAVVEPADTIEPSSETTSQEEKPTESEETRLGQLQEIVDDLAEEIDVFSSKIQAKLAEKAGLGNNANAGSAENSDILGQTDAQEKSADSLQELAKLADSAKTTSKTISALIGSGYSSPSPAPLPKLLITEVAAGVNNSETEYIEIYNPNNSDIEINSDNFQLKLVDSKNEITTKQIKWNNNKILGKGYFLFCSTSTLANNASTSISVDAVFSDQLTDTSGIILADKNYNQDLDKLSWGSSDKPGPDLAKENQAKSLDQGLNTDQALERKKDANNDLIDTDNNSEDFVLINSISPTNFLGQTLVFNSGEDNEKQLFSSPKILITEIQIEGAEKSEDFIELYNASSSAIDISNWQLKKRSKTGTESSVIFFDNNTFIAGQSYFLWASKKDPLYPEKIKANVSTTAYLTENNSIALLDKNDRVVDAVAWGSFGATSTEPFFETEIFPENPDKGFSLQRKYSSSSKEYQDTDNNKQDFQTQKPSPKAKNFLSEIKIWLGDDYAINAWQYIINWQAVDETDEQLNYYQIETKQDQGEWQDLINQTKEKSANFSISQDFTTYYFRAKAVFIDGRESVSKEISAPFASRPVIINEVMYHPEEDAYYEYIELYNLSSAEIDLASWKLKIGETIEKLELATGTSTIIKPNAFVVIGDKPSKPSDKNIYDGFYAIECNSEKICLQIDDASFGNGGLSNQGETIALLNDKDEIIDEISYTKASQDQGKALQKINPYSLSSHESNFSLISGSPNQVNPCLDFSAPTHILNDYIIFENTIFTSKASPYLLFSDFSNSPTLAENKTLIIEPGVILKPQNAEGVSLTIQGTLIAKGTSEKPIKFTSPNQEPLPGDYGQALSFTSESKDSVLDYAVFEYGDLIMLSFPMMSVFETNIKIKNSVFRKSLSSALSLIEADAEIENTLFEDNENIGLSIQGGATKIINSSFKNNQLGIDVFQVSKVFLQNNVFSENQKPISFTIDSAINFDETNKMENNNIQGVLINTKKTSQTATNTLEALPFPYVLENSLDIMEGQSLFINPGAVIKLLGDFSIFEVKGNLFAQGTEGNPIIWTSLKDDQYLGDTNNDGENSAPAKGDWQGIQIFNKADLKNIKLRYSIENPIYIKQGAEVIQENVIIE